jgi:hypothetical protein
MLIDPTQSKFGVAGQIPVPPELFSTYGLILGLRLSSWL